MTDITHRLLDGELLRAVHVPAMADSLESQESTWRITVRRNGELIGHRNNSQLIADPSVLLPNDEFDSLILELNQLAIDYEPRSSSDGTEYRYLTYLSQSRCHHITLVDGISGDFERSAEFNRVWTILVSLARRVGFGSRNPD